jgi:glyoxylase-like metal-dependent hydrolase (beta-lactamase superfamily II)
MASLTRVELPALAAEVHLLTIGATRVYRIADADGVAWPARALFRSITDAELANACTHLPQGEVDPAEGTLRLSFNTYLIASPHLTALIDAGIGNGKERPDRPAWHRRTGAFLDILAALGFSPDSVDLVVNTHLHADHVGWNTVHDGQKWRPTFPRGRYVTPASELAYWSARANANPDEPVLHGAFADSIAPLIEEGVLSASPVPAEIAPGLYLEPAHGHSPGMAVVRLVADGEEVYFLADVLHHPVQFLAPRLCTNFCLDPTQAMVTRARILEECVARRAIVAPYHFAPPAFGRISAGDGEFHFDYLEGQSP